MSRRVLTRPRSLTAIELIEFTRRVADDLSTGPYPSIVFDADARWHERIYRDATVDAWLITWLPTQGTKLHDHGGSAGSFTVVSGQLAEAVYEPGGRHTGALREHDRPAGCSVGFDPRYVHDVRNTGTAPAVSVHAYSAPLTSMTYYELVGGSLEQVATLATDDPEPAFDVRAAS